MIGKVVKVTIDRPLGSCHPNHSDLYYPVNYGYIEGTIAGDGEAQDAYILGVDKPVTEFVGRVIAVIHRKNDVEEFIGHSTEIEKTLEDYLEELNNMTGLESIKRHIMEELKSSKIAQERARRAGVDYSPGTLHMLLVGNAGTGKTTIARLIGKIYGKAGLIKNEDVFV